MTALPLVTLAVVTFASPAFADVVAASANGNTVVVGNGGVIASTPTSTLAVGAYGPASATYVQAEPAPAPVAEPAQVTMVSGLAPRPRNTLGVDALAVLPVGDYGRAVSLGVGAGIRLEVPTGRGFITGRIGAVFHALDNDYGNDRLTLVPLYAGYRMPLSGTTYVAGELGITFAWATVDTPYGEASASDSELGALLSLGARLGALDLRGGLFTPDLDDAVGIIGTAGYDFAAF